VFPYSILTDVETEIVHAGLIPFQGVANAGFGCMQRQSDIRQPRRQELLTVF
jgi:hypothetical protein